MPPAPQSPEALFLAHLDWIDRVVAVLARRSGFGADEREDVASWVKLRLVEGDYAILRKFRGTSALTTYLTTVLVSLVRDYRIQRWGRWRPSAEARRRGRLAVRLETLVHRDAMRLSEAGELLRTRGETTLSDRELGALLAELPRRAPLRPVDAGAAHLDGTAAPDSAEDAVAGDESNALRQAAERALEQALALLPAEDRTIVRMHYWQGSSIAEIARALHLEQPPLYRRLHRLLAELRRRLEAEGVSRDHARDLLGGESAA